MKQLFINIINYTIRTSNGCTRYRSPLVGFALASDPLFHKLQEVANPDHLLPEEMLPGAQSGETLTFPANGLKPTWRPIN